MGWVAAAGVGAAALGAWGSKSAADTQASAADKASQAQLQMFNQTQGNLQPYMKSGTMALDQINQGLQPGGQFTHQFGLQDFQASPAYNFNLQQGQMAIDKAANAKGGGNLYAPQTLQDISKFSQGLASNEFQNAFSNYQTNVGNVWNRLYNTAGSGQNAAANLGGFGTTTGGQIGQNITGAGNAQAAGTMGAVNAVTGSMGNVYNAYLMNQILGQNQQSMSGIDPNAGNLLY